MGRAVAFLILFIPGIMAVIGIKLMRDTLFDDFHPIFFHTSIQFIVGLVLLVAGFWFIGGFIVHRDKKRNLTKK